ncbi:hypothetical protein HY485_01370 [Candidatus Woesearchaeota archaeon]|nr:hypothetical protein [Candidatus Woesearchaeota archaeon]
MHLDEITSYQRLFAEQKLFDKTNAEERSREILAVYADAVKRGYTMSSDDITIRRAAETIEKTIRHNREIKEKYPDALERIAKYQEAYITKTLFSDITRTEFLKEIGDVYLAASLSGYKMTPEDLKIRVVAHTCLHPSILEEIADRISSDDIVD